MVQPLPRPEGIDVALSTSSTYPVGIPVAFETAARLGYDGLEVMVWTDPLSQDADALSSLSRRYGVPVVAVHAPTLLITQRVWGKEAWAKITGAVDLAQRLGADTVVAHPPFRWQREYAEGFVEGVRRISQESGVVVSVENMYPWRVRQREIPAYLPDWDPTDEDYDHVTVDLSHSATAGSDPLDMVRRLGPRLRAPAPRGRHRLAQGRAPRPRTRRAALRRGAAAPHHLGLEGRRRPRGEHPQVPHRRRRATATCWSR